MLRFFLELTIETKSVQRLLHTSALHCHDISIIKKWEEANIVF